MLPLTFQKGTGQRKVSVRTAKGWATCPSTSGTQERAAQWLMARGLRSAAEACRVPSCQRLSLVAASAGPRLVLGLDERWIVKRV